MGRDIYDRMRGDTWDMVEQQFGDQLEQMGFTLGMNGLVYKVDGKPVGYIRETSSLAFYFKAEAFYFKAEAFVEVPLPANYTGRFFVDYNLSYDALKAGRAVTFDSIMAAAAYLVMEAATNGNRLL